MLGLVRRAWQASRDKARLLAPMWNNPPGCLIADEVQTPELRQVLDARGPELLPYHGLADLWHGHAAAQIPDYPAYLAGHARRRGRPLAAVLDLACGTGLLSTRLTGVADEVVGVDTSDAMLAVARRASAHPSVTYLQGDMRALDVGRQFDAAVCASNSINYVADRDELRQVFSGVARHLRPGGVFVFDATTEYGMQLMAGHWFHMPVGERTFALRPEFDRATRRQTVRVVVPDGVETHRRISIDKADVRAAAAETGLAVVDQFASRIPLAFFDNNCFGFHVLQRTA